MIFLQNSITPMLNSPHAIPHPVLSESNPTVTPKPVASNISISQNLAIWLVNVLFNLLSKEMVAFIRVTFMCWMNIVLVQ